MSKLLAADAQRLEGELTLSRAQLAALEEELRAARDAERRSSAHVTEQAATIASLEGLLLQRQKTGGGGGGGALRTPTSAAPDGVGADTATPDGSAAARVPRSATGAASALSEVLLSSSTAATPAPIASAAAATPAADGAGATTPHLAGATPAAHAGGAVPADDDAAALRLVVSQRDRARRRAEELEAENRRHAQLSKSHQSEIRRLQTDNLKLYEKIKFLEASVAGGAAGGGSPNDRGALPVGKNSIDEAATESRYAKLYEEKHNPFAAFHRRERQRALESLNPADRAMLSFSKFFVANKHARAFLFGYIVCLHLLVSTAMYVASHHC